MAIKATKEELAIINERFAKEPLEEAYCIPIMAADTERLIDDRALKLHETTIAKFAKDANERGPGLALTHLTFVQPIPIGKVFAGHDSDHKLYAKAYMPVGVTVPTLLGGDVKTDRIADGYSTGLVDRVSIGFSFERAECNICFEDVRSPECPHSPGEMVQGDDGPIECTPIIYAGEKGRLDHIAIVWQGALDNAKTIKPSDLPAGFAATEPIGDVFAKSESLPEVSMGQFSVQVGKPQPTLSLTADRLKKVATGLMTGADIQEIMKPSNETFALTHNSMTDNDEPAWSSVDKTRLPRNAFADEGQATRKSSWKYPHHWVKDGGNTNAMGCYTTGDMYLHRGGLRAARSAAAGGRSGQEGRDDVKAHLNTHASAIGMGENQLAVLEEWPFDVELLEHPMLSVLMDRLTEEEWAVVLRFVRNSGFMNRSFRFMRWMSALLVGDSDGRQEMTLEEAVAHQQQLEGQLEVQALNIAGLQQRVESLSKLADLGKQYCDTLKAEALAVGVKCMGNAFSTEFYERVFTEAMERGEVNVVLAAKTAWESECSARFPVGRRSAAPDVNKDGIVGTASPSEQFEAMVQEELKTNEWGDNRYGDAVRAVSRRHPALLRALTVS